MAIVIGNKTAANVGVGASTQTLAHNMSVGADGTLLVSVVMANTVDFVGATYDGVAMDLVLNQEYSAFSQRLAFFVLQAPSTGSNNIVITFSGSQFNPTSVFACSFTGAGNYGAFASNGGVATPNSQSITISTNSIIYLTGIANTAQNSDYDIGGTSRTPEFNGHNTNKIVEGALSATGLSSGAQNVTTKADSGNVTNARIEIQEFGGGGGRRRIIIV